MAVALAAVGAGLFVVGATHLHHADRRLPESFVTTALDPGTSATTSTITGSPDIPVPGAGVPLRVRISRLHLSATVVPVRSTRGEITVPSNPSTLGWWIGGAAPGSLVGATVIVGHVDSAASGPGALFHLDHVRPGDTVTVMVTGGGMQRYTINALHTVRKSLGISGRDLDDAGPAQLTLITCGGPFDQATKSYRDNIVAVAAPAE